MRSRHPALLAALALVCAGGASAQTDPSSSPLKAAVQKAISANPEVTARFNAYRAAADAVDAARAGYFPRLDLSASAGRDRDRIDARTPSDQSLNRAGASLTLTQLLWDGFATRNEVGRVSHERLARYFEVLDVSEQTALETARAYVDVLRYRRLVKLAEDNFVQHQSAYNQIQSRFKAGVGRGVDLEQAGARVALSESNLNTEMANLHDVTVRYQRLVGELPPAMMPAPTELAQGLPASANEAADIAIRRNPGISASIEALRSARSVAAAREAVYQPTLQARVRAGTGKNFDGVRDQRNDTSAEVVLNWNLFNGGGDVARIRQQANLVNQAADLRDKACRDVRQTVAIAYNDTRKLVDQLQYLDRNTLAISKARDAYRQQFDIGQRSLLDLLNSENELYTAQRSYANAEHDLVVAHVRTHAAVNQLSTRLGVTRDETAPQPPEDADTWTAGSDAPGRCPAEAVPSVTMDLTALRERAAAMTPTSGAPPAITPAPAPAAVAPARAASVPAAAARPDVPAPFPSATLEQRLSAWAAAWQAKDTDRYLSFYAPTFQPEKGSLVTWKSARRAALARATDVTISLSAVKTRPLDPETAETRFQQTYRASTWTDATEKLLRWRLIKGQWLIVQESGR